MGREVLVGVDVGTTSIKAIVVALDGRVLGDASSVTPWRHDGPRADIDPEHLAQVVVATCIQAVRRCSDPADGLPYVSGVGVTGFAESGVLIDAHGRACAPALAWFDPRGDAQGLRERLSSLDFRRATGRRLNSKPSAAKILWLQRNVPSAASAVRHLCIAEWIVHYLGGEQVSEASLASRTGLLDIPTRRAWAPVTEIVGDLLPTQSVWAGDDAGVVGADIAPELAGATLTVAGLDHQAAVLISGAARRGTLFDSMGTAEALIRTVDPVTPDEMEALTEHDIDIDWSVIPDLQILLAGRLTGLTLERVSSMLGANDRESRAALGEAALVADRASGPWLTEVTNDAVVLGGITDGITPGQTWRAVVEDLTSQAGEALDHMADIVGPFDVSVMAGGWSRNPMVTEAKKRQLGDVRMAHISEPGALGAAFLAGVACGILERPGDDGRARWLS